jgi:hypothetical protein
MNARLLYGFFISILLHSCATQQQAGNDNSGVETTNAISARILTSEGSPAANARVRIRPASWVEGDTCGTAHNLCLDTVTDNNGVFYSDSMRQGEYRIEASLNGNWMTISDTTDSLPPTPRNLTIYRLQKPGTLEGSIARAIPIAPTKVYIKGLSRSTLTDSLGHFSFDSLPAGLLTVLSATTDSNHATLFAKAAVNVLSGSHVDAGPVQAISFLLDDFEDGDASSLLLTSTNEWFVAPTTTIVMTQPLKSQGIDSAIVPADLGRAGKALHITFQENTNYVVIGIELKGLHDFSELDSVEFWSHGSNRHSFSLENFTNPSFALKAYVEYPLTTEWTRHVVRMSDFAPRNDWGTGWDSVKHQVKSIDFLVWGSELWLDDIRFFGIQDME